MIKAILIVVAIGVLFGFGANGFKSFNRQAAGYAWLLASGGYLLLWALGGLG
jgi:hypothetical protein